jgi:chromosome condensin MukBEF MukE localization factor
LSMNVKTSQHKQKKKVGNSLCKLQRKLGTCAVLNNEHRDFTITAALFWVVITADH